MLNTKLPVQFDPYPFCRQRQEGEICYSNTLRLSEFDSFRGLILPCEGEVQITCSFGEDDQKIPYLSGNIEAVVHLRCQRCMHPFEYEIKTSFLLSPVYSDQAAKELPSTYEPIVLDEGNISLPDLISEELILSLPLVPKHEENCLAEFAKKSQPSVTFMHREVDLENNRMNNPFKILESIKL